MRSHLAASALLGAALLVPSVALAQGPVPGMLPQQGGAASPAPAAGAVPSLSQQPGSLTPGQNGGTEPQRAPGSKADEGTVLPGGNADSGTTTVFAPSSAAETNVPWPCAQARVSKISAGTIWSGPSLDAGKGWEDDNETAELAQQLASRRTTLEEANDLINAFAKKAGADKDKKLTELFVGTLDLINGNRDQILDGIMRYARGQERLADRMRAESDKISESQENATANGLVLFDRGGTPRQTLTRADGLISDHVSDVAFTASGPVLATPAGLTFLTSSGPASLYAFQGLVNNHVYTLAAQGNQLAAGTLGGISLLESEQVKRNFTAANSGLRHNWITAMVPAAPGSYLVGTYGAGLATLGPDGVFTPIDLPANTPRDLIVNPNALLETPTHIYAGTLSQGMLVYSRAAGRWQRITGGLPSLNVTAFAARAGMLYVGTENGLVRIPEARL